MPTRLCEEADKEESWKEQDYNGCYTESSGEMKTKHFLLIPDPNCWQRVHMH